MQCNYFWFQPPGDPKSTHVFISLKNLDARTIKYCTFSFLGYNRVGDVIPWFNASITKNNHAILQVVGPVGTNCISDATFERVWYSPVKVSNLELCVVLIEYMDGTKKTLLGKEIERIPKEEPPQVENKNAGCYIATCVYGSYDCPQVWTLRRYRDNTLAATWCGRVFIRIYYAISPTLVKWFGNTNWFKKMWVGTLDKIVENLQENGVENTPYEDKKW